MVFVESPGFTEAAQKHLPDDELAEVQTLLSATPEAGDLIQGGKGLRKLRWKAQGRGKRGGIRILYYWWVQEGEILLLHLFAKNESDNLTKKQQRLLVEYMRREFQP